MNADYEAAPPKPAERATSRPGLGVGLTIAGLLTIAVTGLCGYLVAHAWAACLYDIERYGFALYLSAPVLLLANAVVFGLTCPLAVAAGLRRTARATRFCRLAGFGTTLGIIAAVLAVVLYLEPAALYFTWAEPDDLGRCVGHVPPWWFSLRTG